MAEFENVGKLVDFPPGKIRGRTVGGEAVAVANCQGELWAFSDLCGHWNTPFSEDNGGYGYAEAGFVVCMLHDSVFNTRTGALMAGPAAAPLTIYDVRVEGDDVLLRKKEREGR
jgi:3-phenylpropionate/trans-cinnamate dioxygenase ferredoxin subunit